MKKTVIVSSDPSWPAQAEREAARLRPLLADVLIDIHHVGSTSVPGLCAKPVLDLMPTVRSLAGVDAARAALEAAGFEWRGEYGIPGRRYLRGFAPDLHVHIYEPTHAQVARNLAFRDYLRRNPHEASAYAALKRRLAASHPDDRDAYQDGKLEFVEAMMRTAMGEAYIPRHD